MDQFYLKEFRKVWADAHGQDSSSFLKKHWTPPRTDKVSKHAFE